MSEKTTPSFPFAFPFGEAMLKPLTDAQERWTAALDEATKVQAHGMSHAKLMIDEGAKMAHATLDYWTHLGSEWRRLTHEATKRATDSLAQR